MLYTVPVPWSSALLPKPGLGSLVSSAPIILSANPIFSTFFTGTIFLFFTHDSRIRKYFVSHFSSFAPKNEFSLCAATALFI